MELRSCDLHCSSCAQSARLYCLWTGSPFPIVMNGKTKEGGGGDSGFPLPPHSLCSHLCGPSQPLVPRPRPLSPLRHLVLHWNGGPEREGWRTWASPVHLSWLQDQIIGFCVRIADNCALYAALWVYFNPALLACLALWGRWFCVLISDIQRRGQGSSWSSNPMECIFYPPPPIFHLHRIWMSFKKGHSTRPVLRLTLLSLMEASGRKSTLIHLQSSCMQRCWALMQRGQSRVDISC